jgi:hypothetical protein
MAERDGWSLVELRAFRTWHSGAELRRAKHSGVSDASFEAAATSEWRHLGLDIRFADILNRMSEPFLSARAIRHT